MHASFAAFHGPRVFTFQLSVVRLKYAMRMVHATTTVRLRLKRPTAVTTGYCTLRVYSIYTVVCTHSCAFLLVVCGAEWGYYFQFCVSRFGCTEVPIVHAHDPYRT